MIDILTLCNQFSVSLFTLQIFWGTRVVPLADVHGYLHDAVSTLAQINVLGEEHDKIKSE